MAIRGLPECLVALQVGLGYVIDPARDQVRAQLRVRHAVGVLEAGHLTDEVAALLQRQHSADDEGGDEVGAGEPLPLLHHRHPLAQVEHLLRRMLGVVTPVRVRPRRRRRAES